MHCFYLWYLSRKSKSNTKYYIIVASNTIFLNRDKYHVSFDLDLVYELPLLFS